MTNAKGTRGKDEIVDGSHSPSNSRFERRAGSCIMKNNSMAELYNECSNKIAKPTQVNMRNSVNGGGGMWDTTASSPSKTFNQEMLRRSGSINKNSSIRLLNRDELMGSPLSPTQRAQILKQVQ